MSLQHSTVVLYFVANYETRDYKGRTPLHLATELGRIPIAKYLLSLDVPAECCVVDNLGNHVLTSMIRTMPIVVRLCLNNLETYQVALHSICRHLLHLINYNMSLGKRSSFSSLGWNLNQELILLMAQKHQYGFLCFNFTP